MGIHTLSWSPSGSHVAVLWSQDAAADIDSELHVFNVCSGMSVRQHVPAFHPGNSSLDCTRSPSGSGLLVRCSNPQLNAPIQS